MSVHGKRIEANKKVGILQFICQEYKWIFIVTIWLTFLNRYKLFFQPIGIDTEQALYAHGTNLNWTMGNGRFMSAFIRKLIFPVSFNYDLSVLIMLIGFIVATIGYQYCFWRLGMKSPISRLLFSTMFVSYPTWAEQSYFVCSAFANIIGLTFSVSSAFFLSKWILSKNEKYCLLLSCLFNVFAIGIYQAFFYLSIATVLAFLFLYCYEKEINVKHMVTAFFQILIVVTMSFFVYTFFSKVCIRLFYNPNIDYAGYTEAPLYISNQILWEKDNLSECYNAIISYIQSTLIADNIFGTPLFLISEVLVIITITISKKYILSKLYCIILVVAMFICPYLGCLVKGTAISPREQMILPFIIAFNCSFFLNQIISMIHYNSVEIRKSFKKFIVIITSVVFFFVTINFAEKQLSLNRTDYLRFKQDELLAENIIKKVQQMDSEYSEKKIIFLGFKDWNKPQYLKTGDVIGRSIFSWYEGSWGINYRVYGFMQAIGYNYVKPSIEEICNMNELSSSLSIYPANGCIYEFDNLIVIRLN